MSFIGSRGRYQTKQNSRKRRHDDDASQSQQPQDGANANTIEAPQRKVSTYCQICRYDFATLAGKRVHDADMHPKEMVEKFRCFVCKIVFQVRTIFSVCFKCFNFNIHLFIVQCRVACSHR